jgi:hypothetical protein
MAVELRCCQLIGFNLFVVYHLQYAINTHPGRAIPDCRIFTNLKPQVRWTYMNLTAEFKGVVRSMIGEKDAAKLETLKGQAQDVFVKIRKICFGDPELWIDLFEKSESYEILSRVDGKFSIFIKVY